MEKKREEPGVSAPAGIAIGMVLVVILILSSGCTETDRPGIDLTGNRIVMVELTDVQNGSVFTLSSFPDQPVLIQTFTTTCTICQRQQQEISLLHESGDIPFVMVGLDIDPNENPEALREYVEKHGYYGVYAHSPPGLTRLLVDRFGSGILSPSQAPLILICPGGSASMFPPGIKPADYLEKILSECSDV
jgi:hypothetical protein